jgi:HPt (histidine-containing phosphotransfer) domain-containing protein
MSGSEPGEQERAAFHVFLQKPFTVQQLHEAFEHEALEHGIAATAPDAAMQAALSSMPLPRHAPLDEAVFNRLSALMSADQMHKLYHMTLHDVQRRILRMKSAAECGDEKTYRAEAHSIKGGCGMVGAAELSALAALAEQDVQTSSTIFSQFDSAFARLQGMLETRIGS